MADTAPRLPETPTADRTTYAPYAVLAIAASSAAGVCAVILLAMAASSALTGQKIFAPSLLVGPAVAMVLAFAGRRQVLNSEGARDGLGLCNAAWWVALASGLGYGMYLAGIQFVVQRQADAGLLAWAGNLNDIDLNNPNDLGYFRTFVGTIEPEKQGNFNANKAGEIWVTVARTQAFALRQSDVVQLAQRNRGAVSVSSGGLESWEQDAVGTTCKIAATFRTPEGEFTGRFPLVGRKVDGITKWSVTVNPTGNFTSARLTPYGQRVRDLTVSGGSFAYQRFVQAFGLTAERAALIDEFAGPARESYPFQTNMQARMALGGGLMSERPEPAGFADTLNRFFQPSEKGPREAEQRRIFAMTWRGGRMAPPKRWLQQNLETDPLASVSKEAVELRVPVEIQPPGNELSTQAARGYVVVRCDDPAVIGDLNKLRDEAAAAPLADLTVHPLPFGSVPWKVVRFESDMKLVQEKISERSAGG